MLNNYLEFSPLIFHELVNTNLLSLLSKIHLLLLSRNIIISVAVYRMNISLFSFKGKFLNYKKYFYIFLKNNNLF
jgi:hypothetical protein